MLAELHDAPVLICPRCRAPGGESGLAVAAVYRYSDDGRYLLDALLGCPNDACAARYPVLRGVPVVLRDLAGWWRETRPRLSRPDCAPALADALDRLGGHDDDGLLGVYADAHYGPGRDTNRAYWQALDDALDGDPDGAAASGAGDTSGSFALDLGCAVGGFTRRLARRYRVAVGVDTNFTLVAAAAAAQRDGRVRYRRQRGAGSDENVEHRLADAEDVAGRLLYLLADALDPPFRAGVFARVAALNLLDNVAVPLTLLGQADALLRPGGRLLLASPFCWQRELCDPAEWLESAEHDAAALLAGLLRGELLAQTGFDYRVGSGRDVDWTLRLHDRQRHWYRVHVLDARKNR